MDYKAVDDKLEISEMVTRTESISDLIIKEKMLEGHLVTTQEELDKVKALIAEYNKLSAEVVK